MANLTPAQIAQYAYNAGFRGADLAIAVAVALAESAGNPNAHCLGCSPKAPTEDSRGLWQINVEPAAHADWANQNLYDPAVSAARAHDIYVSAGNSFARDWTTFTDGEYARYLVQAENAVLSIVPGASNPNPAISNTPATTPSTPGAVQAVSGAISGAVGAITTPIQAAGAALTSIPASVSNLSNQFSTAVNDVIAFARWLGQPDIWLRLGLTGIGLVTLTVGMVVFALSFKSVQSAAGNVATIGATA